MGLYVGCKDFSGINIFVDYEHDDDKQFIICEKSKILWLQIKQSKQNITSSANPGFV